MYRNIESLCCVPGTKIVLWINYTSTNSLIGKEICGYQRWGWGEEEFDEGGQKYKLSVMR